MTLQHDWLHCRWVRRLQEELTILLSLQSMLQGQLRAAAPQAQPSATPSSACWPGRWQGQRPGTSRQGQEGLLRQAGLLFLVLCRVRAYCLWPGRAAQSGRAGKARDWSTQSNFCSMSLPGQRQAGVDLGQSCTGGPTVLFRLKHCLLCQPVRICSRQRLQAKRMLHHPMAVDVADSCWMNFLAQTLQGSKAGDQGQDSACAAGGAPGATRPPAEAAHPHPGGETTPACPHPRAAGGSHRILQACLGKVPGATSPGRAGMFNRQRSSP